MEILYSRTQDGGRPVLVQPDGTYRVGGQQYTRKRDLLAALTGHPEGRHWGVGRYFRLDQGPSKLGLITDVLELFGQPATPLQESLEALAPTVRSVFDDRITVPAKPARGASGLVVDLGRPLGIDLAARGGEVAKLLFAGFGRRIHAAGYDPDDVLQQVFLGILARNVGKCPFDARKSSFGHYVHMVCGCVLANYHRKQHGLREHEQVGMGGFDAEEDGGWGVVDAATMAVSTDDDRELRAAGADMQRYLRERAVLLPRERSLLERMLPLLAAGYTRKEVAERLGVSAPTVGRVLGLVKPTLEGWRAC